MSRIKDA